MTSEAEAVVQAFEETKEVLVMASKNKIINLAQRICEIDELNGAESVHVLKEEQIVSLAFNSFANGLYRMCDVVCDMLKQGILVPNVENAITKSKDIDSILKESGETMESLLRKVLND